MESATYFFAQKKLSFFKFQNLLLIRLISYWNSCRSIFLRSQNLSISQGRNIVKLIIKKVQLLRAKKLNLANTQMTQPLF